MNGIKQFGRLTIFVAEPLGDVLAYAQSGRHDAFRCGAVSYEAWFCDGAQSLDIAQFQKMMKDLEPYIQLWGLSRKQEVAAAAS